MPTTRKLPTQCPLLTCCKKVVELPRHMRLIHGWSLDKARYVKSTFGLRKPHVKQKTAAKYKDCHYLRHCPVEGCKAVIKRLPPHLKNVHKITKGNEMYNEFLSQAKRAAIINKKPSLVRRENPSITQDLLKGPILEEHSDEDSTIEFDSVSSSSSESDFDEEQQQPLDTKQQGEQGHAENIRDLEDEIVQNEHESMYLMKMFYDYLISPDCGKRDQTASKRCVQQVKCVLRVIDSEKNITSLFNRRLLRDVFLKNYAENTKHLDPRTIKAYLKSLDHFYNFLLAENFSTLNKEDIVSMQANIRRWSSAYTGSVKEVAWEKREHKRRTRISPEQIVQFERSQVIRNIITILGKLGQGKKVFITQDIFTTGRDLCAVEIFINNGHRPAPVRNMTMLNYNQAIYDVGDDQYTITVMKHKGTRPHGPATVILNETLFGWLKLYIEHLRPTVTSDKSDESCIFLTWTGEPFGKGGAVSNALNSIWRKSGFKQRICANKFRNCAITEVRENLEPGSKFHDDLAGLMGYKRKTADDWYLLDDSQRKAKRAAKILPQLMRRTATSTITQPPQPASVMQSLHTEKQMSMLLLLMQMLMWSKVKAKSTAGLAKQRVTEKYGMKKKPKRSSRSSKMK